MLHIKSAQYIKNLILKIKFVEYDETYSVDMKNYIQNNSDFYLINELKDINNFKNFIIDHGVIFWKNGFDIAPEYLFFLANSDNKKYLSLFKEWGYSE